jgi:hypothetical protein
MKYVEDYAQRFARRPNAEQSLFDRGPGRCGDLIASPAGHWSDAFAASNEREMTAEERVISRAWIVGTVFFCSTLLLIFGVAAVLINCRLGLTGNPSVSARLMSAAHRTH